MAQFVPLANTELSPPEAALCEKFAGWLNLNKRDLPVDTRQGLLVMAAAGWLPVAKEAKSLSPVFEQMSRDGGTLTPGSRAQAEHQHTLAALKQFDRYCREAKLVI